ncbi:MAG: rhodanese-like domain-containing protein [Gammaproteobacteria bacterium]
MKLIRLLSFLLMGSLLANTAYAVTLPGPLVETDWLAKKLKNVTILDVRKDVKSFTAKPVFKKDKKTGKIKLVRVGGHIPGAALVNYKKLRDKKKIGNNVVTRMLVGKDVFSKLMQEAGVNKDSTIVIVSKGENDGDVTGATRLYWQLKYYGHDKMAILNGGMGQWLKDKRKISIKADKVNKGNWLATAERKEILATSEDVATAVKNKSTQLMDTRPLSLYLGTWRKKSYVFANGHIPGAKSFPNELLTQPKAPAKFVATKELKSMAEQMGFDTSKETITYCNSGHLATGSWFVMSELLGNKNTKMYDGSMHEWTLEKRPTVKMKME